MHIVLFWFDIRTPWIFWATWNTYEYIIVWAFRKLGDCHGKTMSI